MHYCLGAYIFIYNNADLDLQPNITTNNINKHHHHPGAIKHLVKMKIVRL